MDVSQGLVKHRLQVWSPVFPRPVSTKCSLVTMMAGDLTACGDWRLEHNGTMEAVMTTQGITAHSALWASGRD